MVLATRAMGTLGCISYGFVESHMSNLLQPSFLLYFRSTTFMQLTFALVITIASLASALFVRSGTATCLSCLVIA